MRNRIKLLCLLLALSLALSGCLMKTVDELYSLPKRSQDDSALQESIDLAMEYLDYCAPLQGDNRQTVQLADLTGDGESEVIVFAKGSDERALKILVYSRVEDSFSLIAQIETAGTVFEQVEYADLDGKPGSELIVGRQLGNEVLHSLSVYSFSGGQSETILTAGYTRFLVSDLDRDDKRELFVIRPGKDTGNGIAELYSYEDSSLQFMAEASLSEPVDMLKRLAYSGLDAEHTAVYAASRYSEDAIITDVFTLVDGRFENVSLINDSGTAIQTVRNYYVYGDDIDHDGLIELPAPVAPGVKGREEMLRWYNLTCDGGEIEKALTYHNYAERWFIFLREEWMDSVVVTREAVDGSAPGYVFSVGEKGPVLYVIYAFTGDDRERLANSDGRFRLDATDEVVYAATLGTSAAKYGLTQETMKSDFNFIREAWKTGEM